MKHINVVFASHYTYAGPATFTVHLMRSLRTAGYAPYLMKPGKRTENYFRDFGYGEKYQNVRVEKIVQLTESIPTIITEICDEYVDRMKLFDGSPCWHVVHDPYQMDRYRKESKIRPIVIREPMLNLLPEAELLLHPYEAFFRKYPTHSRDSRAICLSRIDHTKNIEMILDANRELESNFQVKLLGWPARTYVHWKIKPKYPDFEHNYQKFPKEWGAAAKLASRTHFMVDLTEFPEHGGGGTQYSYLEAIDGGAMIVLHENFAKESDVFQDGVNCLVVNSSKDLQRVLLSHHYNGATLEPEIVKNSRKLLSKHDSRVLGLKWGKKICSLM